MKKFIYILIALFTVSAIAMAQIKMQVWLNDDIPAEFDYSQILKVGFVGESLPDTPGDETEDPEKDPIIPEEPSEDEFEIPVVEAPGEGYTTIVLYIPESSCNEAEPYILGVLPSGDTWNNEYYNRMEFLGNNWWKVTVEALTPENATNFKFRMQDGYDSWLYEPKESYELLEDTDLYLQVKADETNNLLAIADCNNQVLYVKSGKWRDTPCKEPVPAGRAKFVLTVTGKVPAGKDVIFTGSFEEKSWGESDRVMTKQADGTYVWEGEYPENFQFKAFIADCEDLGFGEDDYGYILPQLWFYGFDIPVTADNGSVIEFEGCFQYFCPGDEIPDTPTVPSDNKSFSVSATKTITFSPGNLQYHAANGEWRFAPSQTDYIGADNANISDTYNGWIDMFCWGTGNNPTNQSLDDADFQDFVDWGVNKIGNDAPNVWRTLTYDEWEYLINNRSNASNLKGIAKVNEVNGLILLPDAWTCPDGVSFKSGFNNISGVESYGNYQTISASDWSKLESSGAVFLPAAGCRLGSYIYVVQTSGNYWSTTEYNLYNANEFVFNSFDTFMNNSYRHYGFSVRLVKDE